LLGLIEFSLILCKSRLSPPDGPLLPYFDFALFPSSGQQCPNRTKGSIGVKKFHICVSGRSAVELTRSLSCT
jgi:hypothetical protein